MKSFQAFIICAVVFPWFCTIGNAAPANSGGAVSNEVWTVFERFVNEKYALEKSLAKKHNIELPSRIEEFFAAEQKGDWIASSNLFFAISDSMAKRNPDHKPMRLEPWGPVHETFGTYEIVHAMDPKFVKMFGEEIVKSIPPGSIYFGGTAEGRFLVSAFSQSHSEGRPFFTMTQNALSDPLYIDYLADMYGNKIKVADTNDSQNCLSNYQADAKLRILHDQKFPREPRQVKPGESVELDSSGNVEVSGQVAVMTVHALMTKVIFDKNPTREFYVEESFPLDWMFPRLTPSGAIMKINRAEIPELTEDILKKDHEFWAKWSERLVGDWITYDTSVKDVAAFAEKVFLHHDYSGFHGDEDFIRDESAQEAFSKLRDSIAGIYAWRIGQPPSGDVMPMRYVATGTNRAVVEKEADFAFKQSWAFCPASPEAIYRYVQLLVNMRRVDDALLVAQTALKIDPENTQFTYLIQNLKAMQGRAGSPSDVQAEIVALEKAVDANPTNIVQQFGLAQKYVQVGQNESAYKVLDRVLANPNLTVPEVMSVADAFNKLNQRQRLSAALERLTQLAPESPEAWYDLAASRASLGQTASALEALKRSLDLNDKRHAQNPNATDIRGTLSNDPRFSNLRGTEEFKAVVGK